MKVAPRSPPQDLAAVILATPKPTAWVRGTPVGGFWGFSNDWQRVAARQICGRRVGCLPKRPDLCGRGRPAEQGGKALSTPSNNSIIEWEIEAEPALTNKPKQRFILPNETHCYPASLMPLAPQRSFGPRFFTDFPRFVQRGSLSANPAPSASRDRRIFAAIELGVGTRTTLGWQRRLCLWQKRLKCTPRMARDSAHRVPFTPMQVSNARRFFEVPP